MTIPVRVSQFEEAILDLFQQFSFELVKLSSISFKRISSEILQRMLQNAI